VRRGLILPEFRLIGFARKAMTDDELRAKMRESVLREPAAGDEAAWTDFSPPVLHHV
jgi:glucose-6-phosphate 1-dehydrogenase